MANSFGSAPVAQSVEHVLGKDGVTGSIPVGGFTPRRRNRFFAFNRITISRPFYYNFNIMREPIQFQCTECSRINYSATKDKKKHPDRIEVKKFCPFCRKHVLHKELKK